jgi:hypothetical protein
MTKRIENEDDDVLRDKQRVTVPLMLMDGSAGADQRTAALYAGLGAGNGHRPGPAILTDEERERRAALYSARDARLADAWRNPDPNPVMLDQIEPPGDEPAPKIPGENPAYAARDRRLENAWRNP